MALVFNNQSIPGLHSAAMFGPAPQRMLQTEYFGVDGVIEIDGGRGARTIEYELLTFAAESRSNLDAVLDQLATLEGTVGVLSESGNLAKSFAECRFEGFTHDGRGPIPDVAGQIAGANGWIVRGRLRFFQRLVTRGNG